jgi:hypothetical protein
MYACRTNSSDFAVLLRLDIQFKNVLSNIKYLLERLYSVETRLLSTMNCRNDVTAT